MRKPFAHPTTLSAVAFAMLGLGSGSPPNVASAHEGEDHEASPSDAGASTDESIALDRVYAEPGDWITLPETAFNPREGRVASGSCKTSIGANVAVKLGGHGHGDPGFPDDAWGELSGRWEPFAPQIEQRNLQVKFEVVCATSFNANIEFFSSDWLPIDRNELRREFACPADKPFLMAARCQTSTTTR